jgi:hypothetical protein
VADVQRVQAEKDAAARRADEILHGPRTGAKLTHRHLSGMIWDGPACGLHYDGEQQLPLTECRWHGLAGDDHFPCRAPGEAEAAGSSPQAHHR